MTQRGWLEDEGKSVPLITDPNSYALASIAYRHHKLHQGDYFQCDDIQSVDTTTQKWMVTVADDPKLPHMLFGIKATGEIRVDVTEGADRDGDTELDTINKDRDSSVSPKTSAHRGVSSGSTDGSTTIFKSRAGATGSAAKTVMTGDVTAKEEFILKQNTKYVIAVETFGTIYVTLLLDWYEHESLT